MARGFSTTDPLRQRSDALAGLRYAGRVLGGLSERFDVLSLVVSKGRFVVSFGLVRFVGEGCSMHHATRETSMSGDKMAGTDLVRGGADVLFV